MMNNNGLITNYTYDRNNKLISDWSSERTNSYAYDNNGNLISRLSGSFVDVNKSVAEEPGVNIFGTSAQVQNTEDSTAVYYSYDPMNKLKSVTSDDGLTATYSYDAKGRRISKTVNNVTTNHIWDGEYIVREKDGTNTETSRYYRAGNKIVANKSNNATNYYFSDPHGNIVSIGNNGNIYTYDAFGNQTSTLTNDTNPFRYCGEYFDEETGFIYLRARYYNPTTGRFISEDPAKDGLNWYAYCHGDPVNFWDPTGYLDVGLDENGVWHDWDAEKFGADSAKYQMLVGLTTAYDNADQYGHWEGDKERVAEIAAILRVTDTTITDAILLNNSEGAIVAGHNAVLLLNSSGQGLFFSYYSANGYPSDIGEMRFSVLSKDEVDELKNRSGEINEAITIYGDRRWETGDAAYDRFVWSDINDTNAGEQMFMLAAQFFSNPGDYWILGQQCDFVAAEILTAAGIGYDNKILPNNSYQEYKQGREHWINENGANRGVER